jgi:FAD/FMN-containing dehydrogenase
MEERVIDRLRSLVGEDRVSSGGDAASRFLRPGCEAPGLVVVKPAGDAEVQEIVNLARETRTGIVTANDRYLLDEDYDKEGILLDFTLMNTIEHIDATNLIAHVQRGVTWDKLREELREKSLKAVSPVAAHSLSVAECHAARIVGKASSKFYDYPTTNLRVIMANGRIHRTGTHGFREDAADGRNEGGPNLSNWFFGSDDIFGVMTRASILLWPVCECRTCLVYSFEEVGEVLRALRDVPRTELGVEYLGIDAVSLQRLLGRNSRDVGPWVLVIGLEGRTAHVEHNRDRLVRLMKDYRCSPADVLVEAITRELDVPWMQLSDTHTEFFSLFSKTVGLDSVVDGFVQRAGLGRDDVGKVFTSYDRGRAVFAVYDIFSDGYRKDLLADVNLELSRRGAFFNRPHGPLGRAIYASIPNHLAVLKHLKRILDPLNIMNPGRIVHDEDPEWLPPEVGDGETGITESNVRLVKEKLEEAIGPEWVSDNPVDVSCYGRDFTIFSGERPNIVALPETTEDVQKIVRIAYEHGIPIVPQSTGFNHGGLTVPRKGGILLDLKRMSHTLSVDEEAMTITVGPGVRKRSTWWEAKKCRAADGFHLKPILAMTFGSVSLLSNYVCRGGAGTVVKYGANSDLTTSMTWVLPNGDIFVVGARAIPHVGNLPLHFTPGPDLFGMFFNADGMFGVCTELTAKLYPENDNVSSLEELIAAANYDADHHKAFCQTLEAIRRVAQENVVDFMYKGHPGLFALAVTQVFEGTSIADALKMAPQHPLAILVSGYDAEEVRIKKEIVTEILQAHGLLIIDPAMFGVQLDEMGMNRGPIKMSLGVKDNFTGTYKGAFQWTACFMKAEKIPEFAVRYDRLVQKYWKTSNPAITVEHAMTGTDIQGPYPYCRVGGIEVDFWWDQGNPEEVKRATTMLHKTQKLMLELGGSLFRNMFGAGEYHLPLWGVNGEYLRILKETKKAFDPANLMHPDVLPLTDDYV